MTESVTESVIGSVTETNNIIEKTYLGVTFTINSKNGFIHGPHLLKQLSPNLTYANWRISTTYARCLSITPNMEINDYNTPSGFSGYYINPKVILIFINWANTQLHDDLVNTALNKLLNNIETNYEPKDQLLVNFIKAKFPDRDWKFSKSKDEEEESLTISLTISNMTLIINTFQYSDADKDHNKLVQLMFNALPNKLFIINFNQGAYMSKYAHKIDACWVYDAAGAFIMHKPEEWDSRLYRLYNTIEEYLVGGLENEPVIVHKLYFDGY